VVIIIIVLCLTTAQHTNTMLVQNSVKCNDTSEVLKSCEKGTMSDNNHRVCIGSHFSVHLVSLSVTIICET
jgi:hypothetical protein